jgi:glycine/D-amino acid oxidase-like deaminating enzyme
MLDFVVIGGGIAGISVAARLAQHGSVVVLEAEEALGYHATGRSAALFEENYGLPSTVALNRASRDYLMTANGGVLKPRGLMLVAGTADEDQFQTDVAAMGIPEISLDDALARVPILRPDRLVRAAFHDDAWDIDSDLLVQNFARGIRASGGEIKTRARVSRLVKIQAGWRVQFGDTSVNGRVVVNAAGAWADEIAKMAAVRPVGLTPLRRSMARLPAPDNYDVSKWPMTLGAGEAWYAKPDAGHLLVSPGDEDPCDPHDAWADDMVIAEGLARYEEMVTEPVTRVDVTWAGLRTFSPDRCLVIGADPDEPSFFWCAGQGGYGVQSAPAVADCLAAQIAGIPPRLPPDVLSALSPSRFR